MKKQLLFCGVFVLMLFSGSVFGQQKGAVKFLVDVDNGYFEILVNDTLMLPRYRDSLPVGDYTAKIWSPGYIVNRVDFSVREGMTTERYVEMVKNNDYIQYENDYKAYRNQFHKQFTAPLSLSIAGGLTSGYLMIRAFDTRKLVQSDVDLYHSAGNVNDVDAIKQRIEENNKKYNRQRTAFYVSGGLTVLFVGATIWSYRHFNQNYTEPVFNKESPFKERLSLGFTPNGCGLTFKL